MVKVMSQSAQPSLIRFLLSTTLPLPADRSAQTLTEWQFLAQQQYGQWSSPFERAVAGGFSSLNMGMAFTSGYQAALQAIAPNVVDYNAASFCVTEDGGNKPADIQTSLKPEYDGPWILNGRKSFVSGAEQARRLLVAATSGRDEMGRNQITMVWLDTEQAGVTITPLPALPFAPDISHGCVDFERVIIADAQILPGDGYRDYVKPFRTIEDLHVCGAVLGYVLRVAQEHDMNTSLLEQLVALITLHQNLTGWPASSADTHIALAGARQLLDTTLQAFEAALIQHQSAQTPAWQRDKALLTVAHKARAQRTLKAWQAYPSTPAP